MPVYPYFGSLLGNRSRHEEEACRHHFFSGKEAPEYLLADGKSIDCPFYGKFVEEEPEDQRRGNTRMAYNTAGGKLLTAAITAKYTVVVFIILQNCKNCHLCVFCRKAPTLSKSTSKWLSIVNRYAHSSVRIIQTKNER